MYSNAFYVFALNAKIVTHSFLHFGDNTELYDPMAQGNNLVQSNQTKKCIADFVECMRCNGI
jgi:hypothetical protein